MLGKIDGEWALQPHSRRMVQPTKAAIAAAQACGDPTPRPMALYSTKLIYSVNVTPRGMVPVPALEWRIKEDVPSNLRAVKAAVERRPIRPVDELIAAEASKFATLRA
mmetsp:Transcript_10089/g.27452  ORF Transcript_10089/g.27452 Transcript_10089/m.27452 type:complete len:108 (+) Transcript_10089:2-325(+)